MEEVTSQEAAELQKEAVAVSEWMQSGPMLLSSLLQLLQDASASRGPVSPSVIVESYDGLITLNNVARKQLVIKAMDMFAHFFRPVIQDSTASATLQRILRPAVTSSASMASFLGMLTYRMHARKEQLRNSATCAAAMSKLEQPMARYLELLSDNEWRLLSMEVLSVITERVLCARIGEEKVQAALKGEDQQLKTTVQVLQELVLAPLQPHAWDSMRLLHQVDYLEPAPTLILGAPNSGLSPKLKNLLRAVQTAGSSENAMLLIVELLTKRELYSIADVAALHREAARWLRHVAEYGRTITPFLTFGLLGATGGHNVLIQFIAQQLNQVDIPRLQDLLAVVQMLGLKEEAKLLAQSLMLNCKALQALDSTYQLPSEAAVNYLLASKVSAVVEQLAKHDVAIQKLEVVVKDMRREAANIMKMIFEILNDLGRSTPADAMAYLAQHASPGKQGGKQQEQQRRPAASDASDALRMRHARAALNAANRSWAIGMSDSAKKEASQVSRITLGDSKAVQPSITHAFAFGSTLPRDVKEKMAALALQQDAQLGSLQRQMAAANLQ